RTGGRYFVLISLLPKSDIEPVPNPCMAKAKSASLSCHESISRPWHHVRTSSFSESPPYAAGTTALSQPALPKARTRDRQESSTSSWAMYLPTSCLAQPARSAPNLLCTSSKKGQVRWASDGLIGVYHLTEALCLGA